MLGLPVPNKPYGFCGQKGKLNSKSLPEFRGCVKVEAAIQSSPSLIKPYGFCGQKGKLNSKSLPEFRRCVKVEAAIQSSPSLISLTVSVDRKEN